MKLVPLRRLAEVNPPSPDFDKLPGDASVTFLPLETVWSDGRADQTRRRLKSEVAAGFTRFQAGDVVCPKVTPTFQAGRSMVATSVGAGTTELHILRARPGVDPRWVCYATRSKHFLAEGVTAFEGVAGLQRVPQEFLRAFRVADLASSEQQRVADFLDDRVARIDQIIAARQAQVRAVRVWSAAQLQALYDDLGERHGLGRLGYLLIGLEQGWSPQAESTSAGADEWGVMRSGCVNDGVFREWDNKRLPEGLTPQVQYEIEPNNLLMSRASGSLDKIGSVAVVPKTVRAKLLLCDKVYRLAPAPGWRADYLAPMMRAPLNRDLIRLGVSGAEGMANNLPSGVVRSLQIPLVPPSKQEGAVNAARKIVGRGEQVVTACNRSAQLLQEYKQSLISAAVTGELDVTTAGSGIPG